MSIRLAMVPAIAVLLSAPALSQDIVQLSPAERMAVLDAAAENAAINGAPSLGDGKIHGEVGIAVGSNGQRAMYGSTMVPLGSNGTLGLSVYNARSDYPRRR